MVNEQWKTKEHKKAVRLALGLERTKEQQEATDKVVAQAKRSN